MQNVIKMKEKLGRRKTEVCSVGRYVCSILNMRVPTYYHSIIDIFVVFLQV